MSKLKQIKLQRKFEIRYTMAKEGKAHILVVWVEHAWQVAAINPAKNK